MDLSLTPEQLELKRKIREFVDRRILPIAMERDRIPDPGAAFPWEVIEEGDRLGLRLLSLPKEYGGGGADILTLCLVGEEMARGDLGIAVAFDQTWKMFGLLAGSMTPEQRKRHMPGLVKNPRALLATANTEPLSGSDNILPYDAPGAGTQTTAVRDGDDYVLNG
ncbi:MAG: acyl-CoA dehydrogenase family protein, partial [Candidatus Tectomicrobia bacterium]|nr:acyl-CoA dehydrogenase family protein [Candidatus Tectomicrobia bacterium]